MDDIHNDNERMGNRRRRFMALWMLMRARRRQMKIRRYWIHPILQQRQRFGAYTLVQELYQDPERFKQYFRMSKAQFDHILEGITPII